MKLRGYENPAMLTLYHMTRAVCPQKVRLALAEKSLAYASRLVTPEDLRSPDYLALNPQGYVPTLVHDGQIITESRTISEYLDETFAAPPLMPSSPAERAKLRNWTKQIDEGLHLNIFVLSFAASIRRAYLELPSDVQERRLPLNATKREVMKDLVARGHESPHFRAGTDRFMVLLADMQDHLASNQWLSGECYGLADTDFTPYLRRLEELGLWQRVADRYPAVARWFESVRSRPSFATAITAWENEADREREARDVALAAPMFDLALES